VKLLLSAREAAAALSICEKTLWTYTVPRGPIPLTRIGSRTLYAVADLQAFIHSQNKTAAPVQGTAKEGIQQ
jgi:hypothetical protein